MYIFKKVLDFYINSSIHVALAVFSLVKMTQLLFHISDDEPTVWFAFFGTVVGYNFVKYDALARAQKLEMTIQLKAITILSFLSFIATGFYFFKLQRTTQIIGFVFLAITLLYTLPFFPNRKNARNWAGIKIYIVALCWVGVTLFLPIINNRLPFDSTIFLIAMQRFILVFVLILIFEIIDLPLDDPHLKTVPQQIGIFKTKLMGVFLMILFVGLEFFSSNFKVQVLGLKSVLALTTILFLIFSNEKQSRYYAAFWVESIPVFWWLLVLFLNRINNIG